MGVVRPGGRGHRKNASECDAIFEYYGEKIASPLRGVAWDGDVCNRKRGDYDCQGCRNGRFG